MKSFKRIVCVLLAATLAFSLMGCGGKDSNKKTKSKFTKEGRNTTLTFAAWFDADLQQYLADKFMETHDDVYVELIPIDQNSWSTGLQNLASTGDLPDAFCTFDLATATANSWTMDIGEYYDADPTTQKISDGLKVAGVYNNKRYGLVTEQYPCVVLINKTLFEENNIALPGYDWTIDQMYDLANKLTKVNEHQYGLGSNVLSYLKDVYDAAYTTDNWQYGFDPTKGIFGTKYLAQGYSKGLELLNNNIAGNPSAEDKEAWYGDPDIWLPKTGKQAMQLDWYWTIETVKSKEYKSLGQDWLVYPFPVGTSKRVQTIVNVGCVAETCANPELAYELLKFMTFGEDGWKARVEWYKANNKLPASVPIVKDDEILNLIKEMTPGDDYSAVYDSIDRSVADVKKWVPGLTEFNAWMDSQDMWTQLRNSDLKVEDVADQMEQKLNLYYSECMNKIIARG